MKNLSLSLEKSLLSRDEMRFISGANGDPFLDDGGGSSRCKCVMANGTTSHPVANCDQCFDFCQTFEDLVSTWCIG
jgi:hypothetical protein